MLYPGAVAREERDGKRWFRALLARKRPDVVFPGVHELTTTHIRTHVHLEMCVLCVQSPHDRVLHRLANILAKSHGSDTL